MYKNSTCNFYEDVWSIVRLIPYGRVTSYGAIANFLSTKSAARMVGWAMGKSHNVLPIVPAHRVVNHKGILTGKHHFATISCMQNQLQAEGIVIIDNCIVNFEHAFWSPEAMLT